MATQNQTRSKSSASTMSASERGKLGAQARYANQQGNQGGLSSQQLKQLATIGGTFEKLGQQWNKVFGETNSQTSGQRGGSSAQHAKAGRKGGQASAQSSQASTT